MNRDRYPMTPPLDPSAGMSLADPGMPLLPRNPDDPEGPDDSEGPDGMYDGEGVADYALTVPEDLAGMGIQPDKDHPLYKAAAAWARDRRLSQFDFDELAAGFYRSLAEEALREEEDAAAERQSFIDAFAPVSMQGRGDEAAMEAARRNARPVVDWAAGLLAPSIRQNPDLGRMLEDLFSLADGIALMRAIKASIGERTPGPQPTPSGMPAPRSAEEVLYGATTPSRGL